MIKFQEQVHPFNYFQELIIHNKQFLPKELLEIIHFYFEKIALNNYYAGVNDKIRKICHDEGYNVRSFVGCIDKQPTMSLDVFTKLQDFNNYRFLQSTELITIHIDGFTDNTVLIIPSSGVLPKGVNIYFKVSWLYLKIDDNFKTNLII